MKRILTFLSIVVLCCAACPKPDDPNYRNYPYKGNGFGTSFTVDGITLQSSVSSPDYVGGVTICVTVTNNTGRTIKYLWINGSMKNTFGDEVYCEIRNRVGMPLNITGPINNGQQITYRSNECFYNNTAKQYWIKTFSVKYLP